MFLPGESQGRGSLVGCRLWGRRVGHDYSKLAAAAADTFTKWLEIFPTWTARVTKNLIKKIIPPFGLPQYIQNDNEPLPDLGIILGECFGFSRS